MTGIPQRERLIRIGEVVRNLREEFPDVSISKIRFLEDEGLMSPQRTRGGYRLFSEHDVERLVTILRLQRDEFLPLRVIRDELATPGRGRAEAAQAGGRGGAGGADRLRGALPPGRHQPEFAKELEEFGLLAPVGAGADKRYPETDADIAIVCAQLTRFGVDAAPSAHVPDDDRPRGGPARAADRAGAPLAQRRTTRGGAAATCRR